MKRWQSKYDKLMVSGLLLLLISGSIPWTSVSEFEFGTATLSAMKKPDGLRLFKDSNLDITDDSILDNMRTSAKDSRRKESKVRPKKKDSEVSGTLDNDDEINEETIHRQVKVKGKTYDITYQVSDEDESKTEAIVETEAKGPCAICDRLVGIDLDLTKSNIPSLQSTMKKIIAKNPTKSKLKIALNRNANDDSDDDFNDDDKERNPFKNECGKKRSKDAKTICAMNVLGRLASRTGDDAYDESELEELFKKYIEKNLIKQLQAPVDSDRREGARNAVSDLIENLEDNDSSRLANSLASLRSLAKASEAREAALIKREADLTATTNPSRSMRLRAEFERRRMLFERDLYTDSNDLYSSLVYRNGGSPDLALSQFYDTYGDSVSSYRDALWSTDPYTSINAIQTPASPNNSLPATNFNPALRGARDQGGRNGFPPLNQQAGTNFPSRGSNIRSLPRGPGVNTQFGGAGNTGFPGSGRFGQPSGNGGYPPGGYPQQGSVNNTYPSRFGVPNTGPIYNNQNLGYGPTRFGAPNVMAPYPQSAVNYGQQYAPTSPGYMGWGQQGLASTPVLNGTNYYAGYPNINNPYPNAFAYRPGVGGTYNLPVNYSPYNTGYPQAQGMPYGAPGGSAARPRF
jgi:hypothetical protein